MRKIAGLRQVRNHAVVAARGAILIRSAGRDQPIAHPVSRIGAIAVKPAGARERARILERYQIRNPFLLYAGSIRPQKNIPRLIEAFAVARSSLENIPEYKDLRLIIIGDEISKHPNVRRAVIHSRVENCVRFLGFIPFDTLRIFHELATAFVFPSLYEGFGLPIVEAMALGTPVLTSGLGAMLEVANGAAELVNPYDVGAIRHGLQRLVHDAARRDELRQLGLARAAKFTWERTARATLSTYAAAAQQFATAR